jgi:beta-glucosidase
MASGSRKTDFDVRRPRGRGLWLVPLLLTAAAGPAAAAEADLPPYKNPALPFDQRVADLVGRMTLEEKADQLAVQAPANSRLGIPACAWWTEALHGLTRAGAGGRGGGVVGSPDNAGVTLGATVFPEAIALAAMWDPPLLRQVAGAIADEARAKYDPVGVRGRGLMLWCPTINMARDPRWGRTQETFGEDPLLASRLAVAYVKGLQGDDPKYLKAVATPKHFAVYNEETARTTRNANVSEKVLREYYLPPFQAAFAEGGAMSTMSAFNAINGVPCTGNAWLLTDVLRQEWGFTGAVVCDSRGVSLMAAAGHRYVDTNEQAVIAAINAGLDIINDQGAGYTPTIVQAVKSGTLKQDVLDRAVGRNLLVRFRVGMFDPPEVVPFARTPMTVVGSEAHADLALRAGRESMVLLKNDPAPRGFGVDRLLPLDLRRIDSIAVVGPYADVRQFGSYAGVPVRPSPTPLSALRAAVGDRVDVRAAGGDAEEAAKVAAGADVAVVVLGLNTQLERASIDRQTLELPYEQRELLQKVVAAQPLTIVVLEGGSAIGLEWVRQHAPAALMAWYPGEAGGVAIAETLLGRNNPAGRLPLTFYASAGDLPPMNDYELQGRTYMYLTKPATYPFGHGLSYSTFAYDRLQVAAPATAAGDAALRVRFEVTNTAGPDGDEVPQAYVRRISGGGAAGQPIKRLVGFERVTVAAGKTRAVEMAIPMLRLATWDGDERAFQVEAGMYEVQVGTSSGDIRLRANFEAK